MMPGPPSDRALRGATRLLALLATLSLELARHDHAAVPWVGWVTTLLTLGVVVLVGSWLHRQDPDRGGTQGIAALATGLMGLAPFVTEVLLRRWQLTGESPEIVQLVALRNVMLGLAAADLWPGLLRLCCVLSLLITLGALMFVLSWPGYVSVAGYGVVGIWWLMAANWERMQGRFAVHPQRKLPLTVCASSLTLVGVMVAIAAAVVGGAATTGAFEGWFYGSGGTRDTDPFAARGVGHGDRLVAARERAASFGAVESELFLDSEMPSLYDLFNDLYGEPVAKNRQVERAIGLTSPPSAPQDQRLQESHRSDSAFSTVRRSPALRPPRHENEPDSRALLFLKGRVPLHLRLETFDTFDGRVWTRATPSPAPSPSVHMTMEQVAGKPWLAIRHPTTSAALCRPELHVLKVLRLKTNRIPTPLHPLGAHIDRVDQLDFYGWTEDDVLWMPVREQIPPLLVIHLRSQSVDCEKMTPAATAPHAADQRYLYLPDTPHRAKIAALAKEWAQAAPPGYDQVAAVIAQLRSGRYVRDPAATAPPECPDTAAWFLWESRRGPDYLFATSAVLLIRELGYPARICTGLYARTARYDRLAQQTSVLPEDVHWWAEVCLDGHTWITVEPTPGYEVLPPYIPLPEAMARVLGRLLRWGCQHPGICGLIGLAGIVVGVFRRELADTVYTGVWHLARFRSARTCILATLWLLERRATLAGRARPPHATLARWYLSLARAALEQPPLALEQFLAEAAQCLYAPPDVAGQKSVPVATEAACRQTVRLLTVRKLRRIRARFTPLDR